MELSFLNSRSPLISVERRPVNAPPPPPSKLPKESLINSRGAGE